MTIQQTATINGLLAENIGKNSLLRDADARASDAERAASDAERKASRLKREANIQDILAMRIPALESQLEYQTKQAEYYKSLLSKPMLEIAKQSEEFKETYEKQQEILTKWIVTQKAYKETAEKLGIELNKTPEEITNLAKEHLILVLENKTEQNNIKEIPAVKDYATKILEIRKSKGLC